MSSFSLNLLPKWELYKTWFITVTYSREDVEIDVSWKQTLTRTKIGSITQLLLTPAP